MIEKKACRYEVDGRLQNQCGQEGVWICTKTLTVKKERLMVLQRVTQCNLDLGSEMQNTDSKVQAEF